SRRIVVQRLPWLILFSLDFSRLPNRAPRRPLRSLSPKRDSALLRSLQEEIPAASWLTTHNGDSVRHEPRQRQTQQTHSDNHRTGYSRLKRCTARSRYTEGSRLPC